jgi:3-methyl-2-oxobutanoate hydroxymethyltransferase|tara:strand:- start:126 stop:977 length:852 start_codon:yes stop_codon:yes gene_type:complete
MKKRLKKVFSINLEPGFRNYTVKDLLDIKGKKKLTQILVSSPEEAAAAEEADIDLLLTKPSEDVRKIREAASKTFMTVAIPFIKYSSKKDIVKKALELVEIGADSIHCGSWNINFMKYLNEFKIPFQGHAGLVPRRSTWIGGVRAFGKTSKEAIQLYNDIKDIENSGAWGVEIECVPEDIVNEISKLTKMITISIGSGKKSDAQFLFAEDILGCSSIDTPRHAKMYRNFNKVYNNIQIERINAFKEFHKDVTRDKFPAKRHSISVDKNQLNLFKKFLVKEVNN